MIISQAIEKGFTKKVYLSSDNYDLDLMVRPQDDLETTFTAYCLDESELIRVNGWLFSESNV